MLFKYLNVWQLTLSPLHVGWVVLRKIDSRLIKHENFEGQKIHPIHDILLSKLRTADVGRYKIYNYLYISGLHHVIPSLAFCWSFTRKIFWNFSVFVNICELKMKTLLKLARPLHLIPFVNAGVGALQTSRWRLNKDVYDCNFQHLLTYQNLTISITFSLSRTTLRASEIGLNVNAYTNQKVYMNSFVWHWPMDLKVPMRLVPTNGNTRRWKIYIWTNLISYMIYILEIYIINIEGLKIATFPTTSTCHIFRAIF